jgi:hypothetical protein
VSGAGGSPVPAETLLRLWWLAHGAFPREPVGWAVRQGLGPLLLGGGADDEDGLLRESRRRAVLRWQGTLVHLERVLGSFAASGVRALVLKGAALALAHYPDPALRPMGDLDLLVPRSQWGEAVRALEALDWAVYDVAEHGAGFTGPGGGRLELHVALTSCPAVFPVAFDDLFARALPLGHGLPGRRLADEDTLVHLALHAAFQHGFRVRLGQYLDFERLLVGPLALERLLAAVGAARAWRPLACSLAVVQALLGTEPPAPAADALAAHVPARARRWIRSSAGAPWKLLEGLGLARARWLLAAGAGCRFRLLTGTLWPGRPDGSREVSPWKALARGRRLLSHAWR